MDFSVRQLSPADWAAFRDLRLQALRNAPRAFSEDYAEAEELGPSDWQSRITQDSTYGLFFEGELIGMVQIERTKSVTTRHRATLNKVYVDPKMRGRGAARHLIEKAIAAARADGVLQLHLAVGTFNTGARALYEAFGFSPYGVQPRALFAEGEYVDETQMVLFLDEVDSQ